MPLAFFRTLVTSGVSPLRSGALAAFACALLACSPERDAAPSAPVEAPALEPSENTLGSGRFDHIEDVRKRVAAGEYRFRQDGSKLSGVSRAQGLEVELDGKVARIAPRGAHGGGDIALGLSAWGRPGKLHRAAPAVPVLGACAADGRLDEQGACLRRAELRRGDVVEWWENREDGLEQGFTFSRREAGSGPLRVELGIRGARASIDPGAADAVLEARGSLRLRYAGLRAFDADGRAVPARFTERPNGLAIEVEDRDARYPLVVDPIVTSSSYTAESNQGLAEFGLAAAGAGDVNRDGFADIVVGAWLYDNGQTDEGRAYLYLGSATGLGAAPAWTAEINQDGAGFGRAVASAGDVNGDGYSDVIVGAPFYSDEDGQEGAVFLYLGSASGLSASPAWTAEGDQAGAQLGLAVSSAGDVNRDGRSDVILGAPYFDGGQTDEGAARLYLGTASGLAASAAWTGESDQAGAYYGSAVAGAGDVNRDSYSDVVVGAPYYDNGNTDEGRTYAYHGSALGLVATAWSVEGGQDTAYVGGSIATAGDVNGDAYSDVIVGAPSFTNGSADEGRATVYYGSAMGLSATANWTFEGNQLGAQAGTSVASLGDANGDGFSDVVVGIPGFDDNPVVDQGAAFVFFGRATGLPITPQLLARNQGGAAMGSAVAAAGDVDGDGFGDVLVGSPKHDNMQNDEGSVAVYRGAPGMPLTNTSITSTTTQPQVHDAGDVNGDGFGDVLVGAGTAARVYQGSDAGLGSTPVWTFPIALGTGFVLAGAGDVNGDGYADVMVGWNGYDNGETDEGIAWVHHGSPSGPSATASWSVESNLAGAGFGAAIGSAGDVNGDGYGDVIVGAPNFANGETAEGSASVYLGSATGLSTTAAWTIEGDAANRRHGSGVSSAGDVNRDGYSDFLVSSQGAALAYLFWGGTSLSTTPAQSLSLSNVAVGRAGDVNGDSYGDFFVGLVLHFGSPTGSASTSGLPVPYVTAGDVNGDGYADILRPTALYLGQSTGVSPASAWSAGGGVAAASSDVNGDGYTDLIIGSSTGFYTFFANTSDNTTSAFAIAPQARRTGTTTPISPRGLASGGAFDARLLGRTAFGRGRLKVSVEVEPLGTSFDGAGLISGSAWTDTGSGGIDLQQAVSGLGENTAYHWRARLLFDPSLALPQGWSRWLNGGTLGELRGTHLRTVCAAGDSDGDGTPNCSDGCPNDPNKIAAGACGCGVADTDSDGDGTPNCNDGCPNDPNKIAAGGCGCGTADTDTDGDGTPNCIDACPNNAPKTSPGACGCATPDTDSDGDGTPNCNDLCPNNAPKTSPGVCGCATPDTDSDGDGTPNCNDGCPMNPAKTSPGVCGCSTPDTDTDGDGAADCAELCDNDPNKTAPGVCGCGTPDADSDGDGTLNCQDGCPMDVAKIAPGACGCGVADTDSDGDGTPNCNDGCPTNSAKTQPGVCGCSTPDTDTDGDGTPNCNDGCPNDPNKTAPGMCGCGVSEADSDGDGTLNCNDGCPNDPNKTAPGTCGCGVSDGDTDGDGTRDCNDGCPNDPNKIARGVCGCGTSDADGDSDGTPNCTDGCPADPAKIAPGACGCGASDADSDSDGTPNCSDGCPSDPNKTAPGACGCGQPEATNCGDDCPSDPNKTAPGVCGCGTPDTDSDSDGTPNCNDGCPNDPGKIAPGVCGCGDADTDSDSDGTPNCNDGCPNDSSKLAPGVCGCGTADADMDGDGTPNCNDGCPNDSNKLAPGVCGCGTADTDADGDGTPNCDDGCPNDPNKLAPGACGCGTADTDTDGDGTPNCNDACPSEAAPTLNGCPGGGGEGGQGGEAGAGAGAGAEAGAPTGGRGDGGDGNGGQGDAGGSGAGGDDGEGGTPGVGGSSTGGSSGAGEAGSGRRPGKGGPRADGGCGCRVPGAGGHLPTSTGVLSFALVLAALLRRRARSRREGTGESARWVMTRNTRERTTQRRASSQSGGR